jgi:hypothetical protein
MMLRQETTRILVKVFLEYRWRSVGKGCHGCSLIGGVIVTFTLPLPQTVFGLRLFINKKTLFFIFIALAYEVVCHGGGLANLL